MEPWDGPALVAFTDGTRIGAVLDRNGLRPARYWVTEDGLVVLASEVGVLDVAPDKVVRKGRLEPGRMFLIDTELGKIVDDDDEVKGALAAEHPYADWLHAGLIRLDELPARTRESPTHETLNLRQQALGYTEEEPQRPAPPDGGVRGRADRLDGQRRARARRDRRAPAPALRLLHPAVRPGSPTRRWTRSARSSSPRCSASSGRSRTCSTRRRRTVGPSSCRSRC